MLIKSFHKLSKHSSIITTTKVYLSIKNSLKTYSAQNITRHHNIFKVDENLSLSKNLITIKQFRKIQQQSYKLLRQKWEHLTNKYYQRSKTRTTNIIKSIPEIYDQYQYYTQVNWYEGKQYTTIHRKLINSTLEDQLVIDIMTYNYIRKYYKTVELLKVSFSNSHRYVAFGFDLHNNQQLMFMIKDMSNDSIIALKGHPGSRMTGIDNIVFHGDKGIYYTKTQKNRPYILMYQNLRNNSAIQLYKQQDMQYYLGIQLSKNKQFLFITLSSKNDIEVLYIELNKKYEQIHLLRKRGNEKLIINSIQNYFIYCQQKNGRITAQKSIQSKLIVLHQCKVNESILNIDIFHNYIVLYMYGPCLRIIDISSLHNNNQNNQIQSQQYSYYDANLPYQIGTITPATNQSYYTQNILCYFNHPFIFNQCYSYDLKHKKFEVLEKYQLTGPKFKSKNYIITKHQVPSTTGDTIPLTIIRNKRKISPNKLILYVYGFYGINTEVEYNHTHLAALEENWTICYAHVRGGGQKGNKWHEQAITSPDRSWKDLQECVGYLLRQQYTHPSLLCLSSHSAGAITVWNAINRKPHLYKAVVMNQPFLDVLNTLLDDTQPINQSDWSQFGNPSTNEDIYWKIQSYCPYHNIQAKQYPFIYIIAGQNDYRCKLIQIIKFIKRYRKCALINNRFNLAQNLKGLLLRIDSNRSHLGIANISQQNYYNCQMFALLDYLLLNSKDCQLK